MGNSSAIVLLFCAFIAVHMVLGSSAVDFSGDGQLFQLGWIPARSACQGSIAECLAGEEFEMDSEINRRILATKKYISYGALSRNSVPCSRRGASYYNCKPGAQANPYTRGCSTITRCRRQLSAPPVQIFFYYPYNFIQSSILFYSISLLRSWWFFLKLFSFLLNYVCNGEKIRVCIV